MPKRNKLEIIYRFFIYALPVVLFFSYRPLINFGASGTMNFDLSIPLIWLVLFDLLAFILIIKQKKLKKVVNKWAWLLLPVFVTLSLIWSHDVLRGVLITGILWLLYFAIFAFFALKKPIAGTAFQRTFFKIFFAAGLAACGWCLVQCILDVAGVAQGHTLLCDGCVYRIFGFPHPNGFAAEPQFMGNLLLAPTIVSLYFIVTNKFFTRKSLLAMFFIFVATLFLTLSRGAIYAFGVAMVFFTVVWLIKTKKWRILLIWPVIVLAALFTLNLQGIFSELSRTDDTYIAGVSKAINQLTLGIVDLGGSNVKKDSADQPNDTTDANANTAPSATDGSIDATTESAVFDGYVEVSTSGRVNIWQSALSTWQKDPQTMLTGVGIGSSLISMYEYGALDTSREIINNEYLNLLLELGIIGILLLVFTAILIFKAVYKDQNRLLIFTLIIAYLVSLCFFSGLPNALHIYLLPAILLVTLDGGKKQYHKS